MRPEIRQLPHRRDAAPARGRIRAAGAREGPRARYSCPARSTVRSDRRLLRRLLQNLVSNAIKYTPKGRVLVGCRRRGGKLRIDVYDTGLGIPASKQQRDLPANSTGSTRAPRWRAASASACRSCERIARVLDHKIDLRSTPGRGSRFSVEVPLSTRRAARASRRASSPAVDRGQLAGIDGAVHRQRAARSSTAWTRCSAAGAAGC